MKTLVDQIDLLIRSGQAKQAKKLLLAVRTSEVPRNLIASFAQLSRRLNLPTQILKLLNPLVHPAIQNSIVATTEELALFSVGLTRLGAYHEAKKILDQLDPKKFPQVDLFLSHISIFNWDYKAAIPQLESYLSQISDPYQILVGQLNLAAALFQCGQSVRFLKLIEVVIFKANKEKNVLLLGNAYELLAQYYFSIHHHTKALAILIAAEKLLQDAPENYRTFVYKWKTIVNLMNCTDSNVETQTQVKVEMQKLIHQSQLKQDWETVRDCEFYLALKNNNQNKIRSIYLGTPYLGYRRKIKRALGTAKFNFSDGLDQIMIRTIKSAADLSTPDCEPVTIRQSELLMKMGKSTKLRILFQVLCRDFYRPIQLGEVFHHLYPSEFYNYESSPGRVLKLTQRLQQWLKQQGLPLQIKLWRQKLKLCSIAPVDLFLSPVANKINYQMSLWGRLTERLTERLMTKTFSVDQIVHALQISERSAQRLICWAKQHKLVEGGKGSGHKHYRLLSAITKGRAG